MSPTRSHRAARPRRRGLVLAGRRPRLLAALLGALVLATGSAVAGGAAIAADAGPEVKTTNVSVPAGGTVSFTGSGLAAGARVAIKLDSDTQLKNPDEMSDGRWVADANGTLQGKVAIPGTTTIGAHWLQFLAAGGVSIRQEFTVASVSLGFAYAGTEQSFTGSGFLPGTRVTVKLDTNPILPNPAEPDAKFVVDQDGKLTGTVTVPAGTARGTHTLQFLATGVSIKSPEFAVVGLTLPTAAVTSGTPMTFSAAGLPAARSITVKLDDKTTLTNLATTDGTFVTAADGSLTGTVTVPAGTTAGAHRVRLLSNPGVSVRSAEFSVQAAPVAATVALGATSVQAGSGIPVSGTGFPGGAKITVKLDDDAILTTFPAGADGTFSTTVTLPAGTAVGSHSLRFLAGPPATSVKSESFTVTAVPTTPPPASVLLGASSVQAGSAIPVSGTGFPSGATVTVKLDDDAILTTFPAGADGAFATTVTVPADAAAGSHWLRFLAGPPATSVKSESFTVTAVPVVRDPEVSLGATSVQAGSTISFSATAFPAGQTLSIKLDDVNPVLGTFTIGADGSASGAVTIPASTAGGSHWLRFLAANPSTSVKSGSFTVTAAPQPDPTASASPTATASPIASASPSATPAAASATLGKTSVAAGGELTFSVSRFPAGQTLTVKLDDNAILKTFAIGANGSVNGSVTVPAGTKAGAHWLRFLAANPSTSVKSENFTVTAAGSSSASPAPSASSSTPADSGGAAKATLKATSVRAGSALSFSATGFPAGKTLTVKLDDAHILKTFKVGTDGSVNGSVTLPKATRNGAHWLRFLAPDPPTSVKSVNFTVTGSTASSGASGSGSGSSGGSGGGSSGSGSVGSSGSSGSGGSSGGTTSGGAATGSASSGSDPSTGAKATLSGSSVAPGGTVSFTGTGFPAGEQLTIKLDDQDILQQFSISSSGSVSGTVTVPAATPAGAHWLRFLAPNPPTTLKAGFTVVAAAGASGSTGSTATGTGTGTGTATGATASATGASASAGGATVTLGASLAAAGGELPFTGSGFPASADVTVTIDDKDVLTTLATDAAGSLAGSVILPLDTPIGNHWLTFAATGLTAELKVDFVTSASPSPATLVADTIAAAALNGAEDDDLPPWGVLLAAIAGAALLGGAAGGGGIALMLQRRGLATA
ncbi:alpha-2-macroglobulin family protein [Motilibacter deserti]|uniref:Ig-like domain-containing protein n=1 Tax=Motilibacter deserti TaxID=2714956 RepID=A0ABX0GWQ8_9ACTN|nr:hypothetical protein [Motilibacter deserti]NHC14131.1 hypothetical protein [Motilibacter deserti]